MARKQQQGAGIGDIAGLSELSPIGSGASSTVYRAHDAELNRWVAVKVFEADDPSDPARKRFKREREITANLGKHPHIVQVLGTGFTSTGLPYVVMELFERGSIADRIQSQGTYSVEETIDVGIKIADAAEAAHQAGVLHRDIKPQNVLLSEYGPALADFGIARSVTNLEWSQSLEQLTPLHAPPEILLGEVPTARSDVYSIGSTLYTMLSGRPPHPGPPGETLLQYQLRAAQGVVPEIARGDISPALSTVIMTALAKDPGDRYPTAGAFRDALKQVGAGEAPTPVTGVNANLHPTSSPTSSTGPLDGNPPHPFGRPSTIADLLNDGTMTRPAGIDTPMRPRGSTAGPSDPAIISMPPQQGNYWASAPPGATGSSPVEPPAAATPSGTVHESLAAASTVLRPRPDTYGAASIESDGSENRKASRMLLGTIAAVVLVVLAVGGIVALSGRKSSPPVHVTQAPSHSAALDPIGLTATPNGSGTVVTLHWTNPDPGNLGFAVEQSPGNSQPAGVGGATSYNATGLTPGAGYCFLVVGTNSSNSVGGACACINQGRPTLPAVLSSLTCSQA